MTNQIKSKVKDKNQSDKSKCKKFSFLIFLQVFPGAVGEPPANRAYHQDDCPLRGVNALGDDLGDDGGEDDGHHRPSSFSERISDIHCVMLASTASPEAKKVASKGFFDTRYLQELFRPTFFTLQIIREELTGREGMRGRAAHISRQASSPFASFPPEGDQE